MLRVGYKGKVHDLDIEGELGRFKEITMIESSKSKLLSEFDVVVPVYHKGNPLAYLLVKGVEYNGKYLTQALNYMSFLQTLANMIVVAIENKRMTKVSIGQERFKKELEIASTMQKLLFPEDLPSNSRMDISAKYSAT